MTREIATFVLLTPKQWAGKLEALAGDAKLATRRQLKAAPGDRSEALRYDTICNQLEQAAMALATKGKAATVKHPAPATSTSACHPWIDEATDLAPDFADAKDVRKHLDDGGIAIEIRDPLEVGRVEPPPRRSKAAPPASTWQPGRSSRHRDPQQALWEGQLAAIVNRETEVAVPSGVNNFALTKGLRRYADRAAADKKTSARIVYRDGSEAKPFPLACLDLHDPKQKELAGMQVLRVALLSIRHPEMDPEVDAAWLRNRLVSQVRPTGETDLLVYELSRRKLREATADEPLLLEVFQTGLEPAVVGFYRAVAHHLQKRPRSLVVRPHHYRSRTGRFEPGAAWAVAR